MHPPQIIEGRYIVLDDHYECDLKQDTVDAWIDHVKEKRWWRYEWASHMRAIARRAGFPAGEDTVGDRGVDDPEYRQYEAEALPRSNGWEPVSMAALLDAPSFEEWKAAKA